LEKKKKSANLSDAQEKSGTRDIQKGTNTKRQQNRPMERKG